MALFAFRVWAVPFFRESGHAWYEHGHRPAWQSRDPIRFPLNDTQASDPLFCETLTSEKRLFVEKSGSLSFFEAKRAIASIHRPPRAVALQIDDSTPRCTRKSPHRNGEAFSAILPYIGQSHRLDPREKRSRQRIRLTVVCFSVQNSSFSQGPQ